MKRRVIYIIGAGRSGTTLMDIVLGNAANIFSCGELVRFPELEGRPHGFGPETDNYEFWGNVRRDLLNRLGSDVSLEYLKTLARRIDYHRSFSANLFGLVPRHLWEGYRRYNTALYESIFERIDEDIIVDSSKYPSRALALHKAGAAEISCVYLVRHPVSVVRSFGIKGIEQSYKNPVAANVYYWLINMASNMALKQMSGVRSIKVKYEDLVGQPEKTLQKISSALDIDLDAVIAKVSADEALKVGKLFEGNRVRLKKAIRLRKGASVPGAKGWYPLTTLANQWWWK